MPKILTKEQIEHYHEQGFLSPIDVMTEDEAIHYRHQVYEDDEQAHPNI